MIKYGNYKQKIIPRYVNLFPKKQEKIEEKKEKYISIIPEGRLGNHLFQIISCWAYAKKYNMDFVLDSSYETNYKKYYNEFFNKISLKDVSKFSNYIKGIYQNILYIFDPFFINRKLINSYLQNSNNFNDYRQEVLKTFFNIKEVNEQNNNFFIHIRLTDFLKSKEHNINLETYYKKAIDYIKSLIDINSINFYIISDDIEKAKQKEYLQLLPSNNIIYIDNKEYDEFKTFELCKNCSGAIIGNSTFAWWLAYIINCPNKIVVCPSKFINSNYDFSGLYLDYKIINV
jgi:hypothetical protein